ncbi:hypothetical protein NPIL_198381 [Nephila pilipes]|uniref:Uncharacterized protein n=1 Tax=Nephila pilipes TaxID=299642 RepID=A0A8X6PTT3_NEPPI|nr:hypothetical protein NPIL_198381 [Nephila pilipes]
MLVSCSLDTEELCKSFKENGILGNETSDSILQLTIQHSFLDLDKGIVPGLRYNAIYALSNSRTVKRYRIYNFSVLCTILSDLIRYVQNNSVDDLVWTNPTLKVAFLT